MPLVVGQQNSSCFSCVLIGSTAEHRLAGAKGMRELLSAGASSCDCPVRQPTRFEEAVLLTVLSYCAASQFCLIICSQRAQISLGAMPRKFFAPTMLPSAAA